MPTKKDQPGNGRGSGADGGRRPAPHSAHSPNVPSGWGPNGPTYGPRHKPKPSPGAGDGPGGPSGPPNPTAAQQSAYDTMFSMLNGAGLGSLSQTLWDLVRGGTTDAASLQLALQNTDAWKRRFAGNEALKQNGQAVLSVGEYLATERSYAQIMKNYGLPAGFYDDPADFAQFIGGSVSANELQQRVGNYADLANREDPQMVAQLTSMGMTKGDLLAYMIDPNRAAPLLQRQYDTAKLGARARSAGFAADNSYLDHLAAQGVSEDQAAQGYGLIAGSLADANRLGLSAEELQSEVFDNNAAAGSKRKRLASQERAAFGGSSGVAGGSLNQNTSGSY